MSWETNSVTFVKCDDLAHQGDRVAKIETAFNISARDALLSDGWHYYSVQARHKCPVCSRRAARRN